jgi:hypothetical protein
MNRSEEKRMKLRMEVRSGIGGVEKDNVVAE